MSHRPRRVGSVDRFEGAWAIVSLEGGVTRVPRAFLAAEAKEGDAVDLDTGQVLPEETQRQREAVKEARLKRPGGSGSFDL